MDDTNYWRRLSTVRTARRAVLQRGALAGAGIAAVATVGCGSSSNKSTPATATRAAASGSQAPAAPGASSPAAAASAAAQAPKLGGVISQRIPSDPQNLDIHQVSTYGAVWPEAPAYNQLIQIDPLDDTDSKLMADLADKWETPDNGATYVFHLHPGIKFHDGSAFTSADVKATLDWIKNPPKGKPSPRQGVLGSITAVETPDPNTVNIKLSQPNPSLLLNLATHYLSIGPKAVLDASGDLGDKLIGTGPFKLKAYQSGDRVELEKIRATGRVDGRTWTA